MSEQNLSLPPELGHLSAFIDSHIECLAGSNSELRSLALCAAKHIFDWALETEESSKPHLRTLLATLTEAAPPQTRSRANGSATQRRNASPMHKRQTKINIRETPLPSLFIEGMNTDQIWQQLDLRATRVCENLQVLQGEKEDEDANLEGDSDDDGSEAEDEDEAAEMEVDDDDESAWEGLSGEEEDDSSTSTSTAEGVIDLQEESSEDDDEDINEAPVSIMDTVRSQQKPKPSRSHSQGFTDLDDGFFDLATFNAETNEVERMVSSKRKLDLIADEDSAEESEVDLFGSVDGLETAGEGEGHVLFYDDFFVPPARTQNKSIRSSKVRFHERVFVKKIKAVGKGMPVSYYMDEEDEEDEEEED